MSRYLRRAKRLISDDTVTRRCRIVFGFWALAATGLLLRSAELQIGEADAWRETASEQHRIGTRVPAERGSIVDRGGTPLAVSHEAVRVGIAPQELVDRQETAALLARALKVPSDQAARVAFDQRRWVAVPGQFPPSTGVALSDHRGVYVERQLTRVYAYGAVGRGFLGSVIDEAGAGGIEQEFETHLRGSFGSGLLARDSRGRPIPGEAWEIRAPKAGGSVVLALDVAVQEIAVEALREALESTEAIGGDVVVTDPNTGDVLAMASLRDGEFGRLGSINTSYEPGSTLKPFTLAALLREGKATLNDSVDTGNGSWRFAGRTINDVAAVGTASLRDVVVASSNVGVAKFAQRLAHEEQYEALRDFGFGVKSGVRLPGEIPGTLRRPAEWSAQSAASLAIGYEIAVTPLQMAMAYGAIANGGVLMQPILVRQLKDSEGRLIQEFPARPIRRVVSGRVAREITDVLIAVVEEGTGTRARLGSFAVAGKSGTSRAYAPEVGYEASAYNSSFVAFFPADDAQILVVVKLERPSGAYYGGTTAAPVTRATMAAILAAREPPLDRGVLAARVRPQLEVREASPEASGRVGPPSRVASQVVSARTQESLSPASDHGTRGQFALPALEGLSGRAAVRRLHALGIQVLWQSAGAIAGTDPAAGTPVAAGDTVRLITSPRRLGTQEMGSGSGVDE